MTYKEKGFLSAVIYVSNNEESIGTFLHHLIGVLDENFEKYEIICVNDASCDKSGEIIKKIAKAEGNGIISIIQMSYPQGLEASMNAGVDLAIGDFVFEFDSAVFNFDPDLILKVYRHSLTGYDIVAAGSKKHRISSALFYSLFNRNAHLQYDLHSETFRILSRRAINRIHSMSKTIPYRKALYANCGLKMDTIFYEPQKENSPLERMEKHNRYTTASNSIILFTNIAYKIAIILSAVMMAATLGGVIYTLVIYLLGKPVPGYTTIMLVVTAAFFGVFVILAIVIKYLSVIVGLIFNEEKYIVESIEKITKDPS